VIAGLVCSALEISVAIWVRLAIRWTSFMGTKRKL